MIKQFKRPYILYSLKQRALAGCFVGIIIFLILIVFQPFGTYEDQFNFKGLFLFGYGILAAFGYFLFYALSETVFPKQFCFEHWNVFKEFITFVIVFLLIGLLAYLYHHLFTSGANLSFVGAFYFIKLSFAVAILPFSIIYYRQWLKSKLNLPNSLSSQKIRTITLESNNKKEKALSVLSDKLLFIKSDGNYIEVTYQNEEKVTSKLLRNSLNQVYVQLPESDYMKIHRSYIVNIHRVKNINIDGSSYSISFAENNISIPLSRTMVKKLRETIEK